MLIQHIMPVQAAHCLKRTEEAFFWELDRFSIRSGNGLAVYFWTVLNMRRTLRLTSFCECETPTSRWLGEDRN